MNLEEKTEERSMTAQTRTGALFAAAVVVLVLTVGASPSFAARGPVLKKIETLNGKAIAAYEAGDSEAAKKVLMDAVVLGKENGLAEDAALARTYLYLGLVHIEGLKDEERGQRFFTLALRIDPGIKLKPSLASPATSRAFDQASGKATELRAQDTANQVAEGMAAEVAGSQTERAQAQAGSDAKEGKQAETPKQARARAMRMAEQEREKKAEENQILKDLAVSREREAKELVLERARQAEEQQRLKLEREQQARAEQEKILRELALTKEREGKEREQRARQEQEKLRQDLVQAAEREKKERGEKDQLSRNKQDLERQLAETQQRERAERAAKEQLAKDKQGLEKLLATEKTRMQNELKEMSKQLAATTEREKKERAAKEDLQEEKRLTVLRESDARRLVQTQKEQKEKEVRERAKLAEGPPLPSSLPERLTCSTPDETPPETDVYVHCAPQGAVKADEITLYYRPSGSARFHTMAMERTKKGWYTALVPAALVKGRMLQYYVEAENGRGRTAASNGKPASPNVVMINRWPKVAAATATASTAAVDGDLVRASTRNARKAPSRRR
jgi:hypothetical protein